MAKIFLIGFMGSGKTTYGKHLAKLLNVHFTDLDEEIEKYSGKSVSELFESFGEDCFREIEREMLQEIASSAGNAVVSTGGGTPCFFDNLSLMKDAGRVVYLKVPANILVERLTKDKEFRPLLKEMENDDIPDYVNQKLKERSFWYSQAEVVIFPSIFTPEKFAKS
jgi:shikimate kinase